MECQASDPEVSIPEISNPEVFDFEVSNPTVSNSEVPCLSEGNCSEPKNTSTLRLKMQ